MGAPAVLVVDAATFLLSALVIQVALPVVAATPSTNASSLRSALRILISDKVLRSLVGAGIVSTIVFSAWSTVMAPIYGQTVLHNSLLLGVLLGAESIGGIGGSTISRRVARRVPRAVLFPAAIALAVVPVFAALALTASVPVLIAALFLGGVASGVYSSRLISTEYERIPESEQGHAFGLIGGLGQAGVAIGPGLVGIILTRAPLPAVFAGIVIIGLVVAASLRVNPALRSPTCASGSMGGSST
ncbi:MFS transporter [Frondihabitans sp. PAMC 28766]|uniref:MFS transporter n=1 Tax=Frondihabitans sp. PAMC 28766 TaxID=1795630 RepID=UPI0012FF678F|nr:MFS transporter [Frondihabitans sp. PAMC 28766]